ncbi:MAG: phytoene desaturase family protein, partial [Clostridium sp.]
MMDKSNFDIVVIGGGISGIVTTAILASEGYEVCLIEKESSLGGCIYSLNNKGHILQAGAHHLGGLGDGECVRRILTKLGLYSTELFVQNRPLKGIIDNERFNIPFEISELKRELLSIFKDETENIIRFFSELESFKEALITNNDIIIFKYFQKFGKVTFNDLLNKYFKNIKIKAYLSALGPGYGGVTANGSAFTMASLLATYGEGAFNVKGGMNRLVDILEDYINKFKNARIYKETLVENLVIENEKVSAIQATKGGESIEIGCKKIIITSNVINIYKMVNNNLYNKRFHNKIKSLDI